MVEKFKNHLTQKLPFLKSKKILLALSGGVDSIVLMNLLHASGYTISVAHCNFKLRGIAADEDQLFCKKSAKKLSIPFYTIDFDTKKYAEEYKLSIQMAARELRYKWFKEIKSKEEYTFIATAHHLNDSLETFLINLSRGTGLKGLLGVPEYQNEIVRPLLTFSKEEIKTYAKENQLEWREDGSNSSTKYLRNHIRLNIVPELEKTNEQFLPNFQKTIENLGAYSSLIEGVLEKTLKEIILQKTNRETVFDTSKLLQLNPLETYLHLIFNPYGFSQISDIINVLKNTSGKQLINDQYRIIKSRNELFLIENSLFHTEEEYKILNEEVIQNELILSKYIENTTFFNEELVEVDAKKLFFPLRLRRKKEGDVFFPLGMTGKKKLSKFFKDQKLSINQKEEVWLLENNNREIIWVVGLRLDNRFKINEETMDKIRIKI